MKFDELVESILSEGFTRQDIKKLADGTRVVGYLYGDGQGALGKPHEETLVKNKGNIHWELSDGSVRSVLGGEKEAYKDDFIVTKILK